MQSDKAKKFTILFMLFLLTGCAEHLTIAPDEPYFSPVITDYSQAPLPENGSLYTSAGLSLYQTKMMHQVGDIITVILSEKTSAKKNASTTAEKTAEHKLTPSTIFGDTNGFLFDLSKIPFLSSKNKAANATQDLKNEPSFEGSGNSSQDNNLTGNITVTVAQVLPNKNLVVKGEKWLTLNQGSEFIRISGIIRPDDISPTNEIMSQKIANARIAYGGKGVIADANAAGWLTRFFLNPIMPF